MLNTTHDMKHRQGIRENKPYEATVVDVQDPMQLCRIRARVDAIMDGIPDNHLPWAIPDYSHADGASSSSGSHDVPSVGTRVQLTFQTPDLEHPVYSGYHVTKKTLMPEMKHNYPSRKVTRLGNGTLIIFDKKTNEIFFRAPGNVSICIIGNVEQHIYGNVNEKIDGNVDRHIMGNVNETIDGNYKRMIKGNRDETVIGMDHTFSNGERRVESSSELILEGSNIWENSKGAKGDTTAIPDVPLTTWPGVPGGERGD